jgi:hypothetical protein
MTKSEKLLQRRKETILENDNSRFIFALLFLERIIC